MPDVPPESVPALEDAIYKTLFEHMLNGMIYARLLYEQGVAVDFVYLAVNPAFLFQTGLANVVGHRSSEIVPSLRASNPELIECYARVAAGGGAEKFEIYISGMAQWFEIVVYSPREQYFIVVFDVITARKGMQADKERLQAQLLQAQKMEAIGHLAGGIAHDFNNVLATILGFVELASRDSELTRGGRMQGYLSEVKLAAKRASELIQKMLVFSRSAPQKETALALPPAPAVREIVRLLTAIMSNGVRVEVTLDEVGAIAVTPVDLQQMLMNLVINARDAILEARESGVIRVGLHDSHVKNGICASCHACVSGDFVELAVADDGRGIPPEIRHAIFTPFYTTKEIGKGSGLGLAVVHGLVHDAGGHILIECGKTPGTTVRLLFPGSGEEGGAMEVPAASRALGAV